MKALLAKFLPLDRIISIAMRFGLLKAPLELAAKGWKSAQGFRTDGSLALAALVAIAAGLHWLPWDIAKPIIQALCGVASASLMEKINKALPLIEQATAKVAEEAAALPTTPIDPASGPNPQPGSATDRPFRHE